MLEGQEGWGQAAQKHNHRKIGHWAQLGLLIDKWAVLAQGNWGMLSHYQGLGRSPDKSMALVLENWGMLSHYQGLG